jgi:hypothetical protein
MRSSDLMGGFYYLVFYLRFLLADQQRAGKAQVPPRWKKMLAIDYFQNKYPFSLLQLLKS